jgi:hypothetical protein
VTYRSASDALPEGERTAENIAVRLLQAYASLFSGSGSKLDAEIVLVDLGVLSRYYDTAMMNAPAEDVKAFDARRDVFRRIIESMTLAGSEPTGLHLAVLRATPTEETE